MIINIEVKPEDFKMFSKFAFSRISTNEAFNIKKFIINIVIWLCMSVVFFSVLNRFNIKLSDFHWPSAILTTLPFILFGIFFFRNLMKIEKGALPKENGLVIGKRVLEFTESGITDTCDLGHFFYIWDAIEEIVVHQGTVYLFLDRTLAQIIPSSSFNNDSERSDFLESIKKMHSQQVHGTS